MEYSKPNFEHEWNEALRYREFEKMGEKEWIEYAKNNFQIVPYNRIKNVIGNVDLDFENLDPEKKQRFEQAYKKGKIEIPIAVKFSENDYDLLGGNTRLSGLIKKGKNPKIWVIDMEKEKDISEKWSQKYKNSIDCNNPKGFSQRAHCQGKKKSESNEEKLKGGLADNMSLGDIAHKHKVDVKVLTKQFLQGVKVEMEHTDDRRKAQEIAMDHLSEDPKYYTKLKKVEAKETDASSSGSFEGPLFSGTKQSVVKRKITTIPNFTNESKSEIDEQGIQSSGQFDVPAFGKTTKGRKNPLAIDGPDSIYKSRAVKDKKWPRFGGPGGVYVKVKEKCKKFPYCNQGNTGALEFIKEDQDLQIAINETSKKYGIPYSEVEKLVLNEISKIFI